MRLRARPGLAVLLALACGGPVGGARDSEQAATPAPDGRARELARSLEVKVGRDSVRFVLHVTNPAAEPVALEFSSTQRYDFLVFTPAGEVLWRWSDGRLFAQVIGTETLSPGQTLRYEAVWPRGDRTGEFEAVGRVTARDADIEARTEFEVP